MQDASWQNTLEHIPRLALGSWPTPVHPVPIPQSPVPILCKREDLSGGPYGGNKVRKLEFLLGRARQRWPDGPVGLVTFGAAGSHHAVATAVYGRSHQMSAHLVLVPRPHSLHAHDHLQAAAALAGSVHPAHHFSHLPVATLQAWRSARRSNQGRAMIIPPGGSTPLGTIGSVLLGLEITQDVSQGRIPAPQTVFVAVGTGATAAGLWLGLRLGGLQTQVVGVRVYDRYYANQWTVRWLAKRAAKRLGATLPQGGIRIEHGFIGDGYGHPTSAGLAARDAAKASGLELDHTYTAKALAACLAARATAKGPLMFVHTASDRLPHHDPVTLPASVTGLLQGPLEGGA